MSTHQQSSQPGVQKDEAHFGEGQSDFHIDVVDAHFTFFVLRSNILDETQTEYFFSSHRQNLKLREPIECRIRSHHATLPCDT